MAVTQKKRKALKNRVVSKKRNQVLTLAKAPTYPKPAHLKSEEA